MRALNNEPYLRAMLQKLLGVPAKVRDWAGSN